MKNRRVLIVGGAGLTGRNIVKRLAARGAVIAVASPHAVNAGFLRPMGDVGQIATIDIGIGEEAALAPLVAGSDIVICAAGTLVERGRNTFDLVHHRGPAMLAKHAAAAGVGRFLHFSSMGADPASPSAYERSKAAGEAAVSAAFPGATILRPSLIFGPDDVAFNRVAAMVRVAPFLPLVGGGETKFQPVFADDVAAAAIAALDRFDSQGKVYALGGPEIFTLAEMMQLVLKTVGRRRLLVPVPLAIARFLALFLELLPNPPMTREHVTLTQANWIVQPGMPGLAALGVTPTALVLVLPTYLDRFRRGGRFPAATEAANRLT